MAKYGPVSLDIKGGRRYERLMKEMIRKLGEGTSVRVGFLESAKYPNGQSVAQVALWNEFGTETTEDHAGIPPRPFFRDMIAKRSPKWPDALAKIAVAQNYNARKTMELMGEGIKGQLQRSINEFADPPNAPSTVARKGFNKPLIETAVMLRSVSYEVTSNGP